MVENLQPPVREQVTAMPPEAKMDVEQFVRAARAFGAPEGHGHYVLQGTWNKNKNSFMLQETDKVVTEYKFSSLKARSGEAQSVKKSSFRIETDASGEEKRKPVQFNFEKGGWEDKSLLRRFVDSFKQEQYYIAVLEKKNDRPEDMDVMHVLEPQRAVGEHVHEIEEVGNLSDAVYDLELKAGFHRGALKKLEATLSTAQRERDRYRAHYNNERRRRLMEQFGQPAGSTNVDDDPRASDLFGKVR